MSKFMKFWLLIICGLFIFLIIFTDRVNAETITDMRVWSVIHDNTITAGNYGTGNGYVLTNVVNGGCSTCRNTIRVTLTNIGENKLKDKIVTFTFTHIGNGDLTEARLRDDANHIYACETYSNQTGGIVNVICPYVGTFNGGGEGFEFNTYGSYNTRINISYFNYFNSDTQTLANIYSTLLQQQQQNNTNTQSIINSQNQNAQQQHQDAQNINNSITNSDVTGNNSSSSITSIGNTFNTQEDFLLNLLTIPYTLWTSILNVFSNSCAPLDVGTMFNYHLVFPCIELNDFLGGIYATIIDVIFTAIIYSAFIRRVIKYFRELLTLDEHALITGGVKIW